MRISDWSSDVCSSDLIALQQFGDDRSVLIRAERQDGGEAAQTAALQSLRAAIAEIDPGASIERAEVVGPKVSGELARSGMLAVLFAAAAMLCYIWWRFEWHFAIGAIVTLVLDQIGRAHVLTPVPNSPLVCRLLPEPKPTTHCDTH